MKREVSRDRRSRVRKTARLLRTPATLGVVLAHVRNGGSLIGLCETWGVRYSDIIAWVRADKGRLEQYEAACKDRSEWTEEMILGELRLIARFNIQDLYYPTGHEKAGRLKPMEELDPEVARCIHSVKIGEVKVYDRLKALELAAKSRGLLVEKSEVEVGERLEDLIGESMGPAAPPAGGEGAAAP